MMKISVIDNRNDDCIFLMSSAWEGQFTSVEASRANEIKVEYDFVVIKVNKK